LFSGGHITLSEPYNTGIIYDANPSLSVDGLAQNGMLRMFPNPAVTQINIMTDNRLQNKRYAIFDVRGKAILQGRLETGQTSISTTEFASGIYSIGIEGIKPMRFVVER
jgi:hypothetical protein